MIPAAFDYLRATSLSEAEQALAADEEARPLAGGHSLLPLMRLRLSRPSLLVDLEGIEELGGIAVSGGCLRIGAMVRHSRLEHDESVRQSLPILSEAAAQLGDPQVRNRGTIGGSVAHADSAGDYPTLCLALDAEIVTTRRSIPAAQFFTGLFSTALEHGEIVREVVFPLAAGPHRYLKHGHRLYDWALVAVAAQQLDGAWRIALTNVAPVPVRAGRAEEALAAGASPAEAAELAAEGLEPSSDLRASRSYKLHLVRELTRRALGEAGAAG